jgi:hypothetical protein
MSRGSRPVDGAMLKSRTCGALGDPTTYGAAVGSTRTEAI